MRSGVNLRISFFEPNWLALLGCRCVALLYLSVLYAAFKTSPSVLPQRGGRPGICFLMNFYTNHRPSIITHKNRVKALSALICTSLPSIINLTLMRLLSRQPPAFARRCQQQRCLSRLSPAFEKQVVQRTTSILKYKPVMRDYGRPCTTH